MISRLQQKKGAHWQVLWKNIELESKHLPSNLVSKVPYRYIVGLRIAPRSTETAPLRARITIAIFDPVSCVLTQESAKINYFMGGAKKSGDLFIASRNESNHEKEKPFRTKASSIATVHTLTSLGVANCKAIVIAGWTPIIRQRAIYSSVLIPFSRNPSVYAFTPPEEA